MSPIVLLPLLAACADGGLDPLQVSAEFDPVVPTLLHVHWQAEEAVYGEVTWELDGDAPEVLPPSLEATHSPAFEVLGIPAGTRATLTLRNLDAHGAELGAATTVVDVPAPPENLAAVTPVTVPEDPPTRWVLVASVNVATGEASVQVVDWKGRPVWWLPPSNTIAGFVRVWKDGHGIGYTTNWELDEGEPYGALGRTSWDGTTTAWSAPQVHHDLYERDDGVWAMTSWMTQIVDEVPIAGEQLLLVDEAGVERVVWDGFANVPVVENRCWDLLETSNGSIDWMHANGIGYDAATDTWLLSLYCQESVLAIDGETGETLWGLGGELATVTIENDPGFGPQHAPRFAPGGVRLFDNGMDIGAGSRVVSYVVDAAAGTASATSEWRPPDASYSGVLGESNDYGGGQLVAFGFDGSIFWHDPAGAILGELQVEGGETVGSVEGVAAMPLAE